jgi:hypothetical protein
MKSNWIVAISAAVVLSGCVAKYRVDSYEGPAAHIDSKASFYVTLPADGRYASKVYPGSGIITAQAISTALLTHVEKSVIGTNAGEGLDSALSQAKHQGLSYVFNVAILNWEDRATEWSGIPDKLTLRLAVYEAASGKLVSATVSSASSKWGTLGGDHPQDLLTEPIERFVRPLF